MILEQELNLIKSLEGYVPNSLFLKSKDMSGAVYKYLVKDESGIGRRKEVFFAYEWQAGVSFEGQTVLDKTEVEPAE